MSSSVKFLSSVTPTKMKGKKTFSEAGVAENGTSNGNSNSNNKAVSGRRRFGENGFEEQGGYMAAKKAKLDNQFNTSVRGSNGNTSDIFSGLSVYINGYTNPPEPELRELFIKHGGTFHPYNSSSTSYVIATNLSAPSKRLYSSKTITPNWIMDSIAAQKVLDTRHYMLYNLNQESKQSTLSQFMGSKKPNVLQNETVIPLEQTSSKNSSLGSTATTLNGNGHVGQQEGRVCESEDEFFECSQDFVSPIPPVASKSSNGSVQYSNGTDKSETVSSAENGVGLCSTKKSISNGNGSPVEENGNNTSNSDLEMTDNEAVLNGNGTRQLNGGRIKTATDDGFLEDFFGRSRLHLISEQKKEMQLLIGEMRKKLPSVPFTNLKKFESEVNTGSSMNGFSFRDNNQYLMHIDLDCFFVSVGLLSRPYLRGKPVVVTHSSGKVQESRSDIACASYEARKFGVKNGMWVGDAKGLCPSLEVIPYDFEEYRRVSKRFFEVVATVTLDIDANSVDEMVVDVTNVLKNVPGSTPESLATFFRKIILEETKCPASVGIGSNRLLAKLAVKLAKPDGIHHLKMDDAPSYIHSMKVRDLPGVGWSNEEKLHERFGVETCGDLLRVPLNELKTAFGEKTAERMHSLCKGIDTSELKFGIDRPKSVSVDVNFGIRFTKEDDVTNFLINICKELGNRADRIQALSTHFTLKLLIRKKGAGDPLKPGGHGIVDTMTRSRTLYNPTRNWQELYKTACSLIRLMRVPPTDYRGVGVTLSDLTFDCDKTGKKSVQRTLTDMPISRAHQMLSISKRRNKASATATTASALQTNLVEDCENNMSEINHSSAVSSKGEIPNGLSDSVADGSGTSEEIGVTSSTTVLTTVEQQQPEKGSKTLPVDIQVLRQLPREIAEEQCQFYGISKDILDQVEVETEVKENGVASEGQGETGNKAPLTSYYDNIETVDQSFLSALPDNVRQDVLIQLQEAKGRRIMDKDDSFDEQQPCTSKQAIERIKKLEEQRKVAQEKSAGVSFNENEADTAKEKLVERSPLKINLVAQPIEDQTTPIIDYPSSKTTYDPKTFWDIKLDYQVLPQQKMILPALNNCTEIADVRNLIRQGLEVVSEPTSDDEQSLKKYFKELVAHGWLNHTQILLKFVQRRIVKMGSTSQWTPILNKIIEETQIDCKRLYHGVLDLES